MKITISEQDLAEQAVKPQPAPYQAPPQYAPSNGPLPLSPRKTMNPVWILTGSVGGVLLLLTVIGIVTAVSQPQSNTQNGTATSVAKIPTKADYIKAFLADTQEMLKDPKNVFFKYVEESHLTVKAKGASIKNCSVDTIDGSDSAGLNGENISRIYLCVTVSWDGNVHKDGYSDVSVIIDPHQNKILEGKISNSNAAIDVNDPALWQGLGEAILLFLQ